MIHSFFGSGGSAELFVRGWNEVIQSLSLLSVLLREILLLYASLLRLTPKAQSTGSAGWVGRVQDKVRRRGACARVESARKSGALLLSPAVTSPRLCS